MAEFGWTPLSKAFAELDVLPPFPVVFNKILEITESDAGSREELLKALSLDQAIAAQVLRASNSVFYGMAGRVGTLDRAVALLGETTVREIAILCAASGFLRRNIRRYGILSQQLWSHSVSTAMAARTIAGLVIPKLSEEAFTAGLVHDIGKLIVDRIADEETEAALRAATSEGRPNHHMVEMEAFGFDHCALGYFFAKNANFPEELRSGIAYHHEPNLAGEHTRFAYVIHLADALSHFAAMGIEDPDLIDALDDGGVLSHLEISASDLVGIFAQVKAMMGNVEEFLGL